MKSGKHESRLSIRTISHGYQNHQIDNREFLLDKHSYLLVEEGATFESDFDNNNPSEALLVAFNMNDLNSFSTFLNKSDRKLLDDPFTVVNFTSDFRTQLVEKREAVNHLFYKIKLGFEEKNQDKIYYEELFQLLVEELLHDTIESKTRTTKIKTVKKSTRDELIRRIHLAKTFIDYNLQEQITIEDLAKVAMMSPFHFSRIFKLYFKCSPYKYLTRKRIQKASFLLEDSNDEIFQIVQNVGFQNHSSFGRKFKSETGFLPKDYRQMTQAKHNGFA